MKKVITDTSTHYYYEVGDVVRELSTDKEHTVKQVNTEKKEILTTTGCTIGLTPNIKPTESTLKNCSVQDKRKKSLDINVKYFDSAMPPLEIIEKGDWVDVRVVSVKINGELIDWNNNVITYKSGDFIQAYLGFAMELPEGYEAHVAPRGSTFKNYGILQTNSVGVVDESFKGDNDQWFVPFYAVRDKQFERYDRIAQFRIMRKMPKLSFVPQTTLNNEDRNGFGSTGTK